jgi:hypothetical protein
MITKDILSILIAHFNSSDWPFGVNESKLYDRSSISIDKKRPGWYIVEIERHRSALNATYRKGQPMAAYQTYWMRYAVHQETGKVENLPETSNEIDIDDVDVEGLVDEAIEEMVELSIDLMEDGKYSIRDQVSKYEQLISSYEEAAAFALKIANENADDYLMIIKESSDISEDQLNQMSPECREYINTCITNQVNCLWEKRERRDIMGDKGGKKDKEKGQKQNTEKQKQKSITKQDKQPKRTPKK